MNVPLAAVNQRLTRRVGTDGAGRIVTVIKRHFPSLDQNDCRAGVTVPTALAARSNSYLLHYGFTRARHVNYFLFAVPYLELDIGRLDETRPSLNECGNFRSRCQKRGARWPTAARNKRMPLVLTQWIAYLFYFLKLIVLTETLMR
jgi:hypothetical protein